MADQISNLQRDYLADIYELAQGTGQQNPDKAIVTSAQLADRLLTNQSNVNRVIERLRDKDLVQHERYVGVQLTERGLHAARETLRKQAIVEAFLVNKMGFQWHEVYDEARQLRHNVNPQMLQRMWHLAGRPERSPFGDWIETPPEARDEQLLAAADPKRDYCIVRVLTREHDRLVYLDALGLRPEQALHLLHKAPFNGPLQIQMVREYRIVGRELAQMIVVTPR